MRNVIKRVMGLVLCAALILGDNATLGFAQELSDISVETLLEDEAFEAEENLTDVSFNDAYQI